MTFLHGKNKALKEVICQMVCDRLVALLAIRYC